MNPHDLVAALIAWDKDRAAIRAALQGQFVTAGVSYPDAVETVETALEVVDRVQVWVNAIETQLLDLNTDLIEWGQ